MEFKEVEMKLSEFFPLLNNSNPNSEVWYLQSQNGKFSARALAFFFRRLSFGRTLNR